MTSNNRLQAEELANVAARCAEESARFYSDREHDPRHCFELFRRAFGEASSQAWEYVYRQYGQQVIRWVVRHPAYAGSGVEADRFANEAFAKMWRAVSPEKFQSFSQLSEVLRYLKMCVGSVLTDYVRKRNEELALDDLVREPGDGGAPLEPVPDADRDFFWQVVLQRLNGAEEVAVLQDSFIFGLKPSEILANRPDLFGSVRQIYRVKENLLDRLRRDAALQEIFADYA